MQRVLHMDAHFRTLEIQEDMHYYVGQEIKIIQYQNVYLTENFFLRNIIQNKFTVTLTHIHFHRRDEYKEC